MPLIDERVHVPGNNLNLRGNDMFGCLGFERPGSISWITCRESADTYLAPDHPPQREWLYYRYMPSSYNLEGPSHDNINRMFEYVEGLMGWTDRTRIITTDIPDCVVVFPSKMWLRSRLPHVSLFTVLLRISPYFYEWRPFDEVLERHNYSKDTKPAIHHYIEMKGNCLYAGNHNGWHRAFQHRDPTVTCERLLVDPKRCQEAAYLKWETDGRPKNSDLYYWTLACNEIRYSDTIPPAPVAPVPVEVQAEAPAPPPPREARRASA